MPPSPSTALALSSPQPAFADAAPPSRRGDLKSWWKGFKRDQHKEDSKGDSTVHIWGVPLRQSITYANVAISLQDAQGRSYIYGYVPIVVAKCGVYLKEHATNVEGIFRLSGSERRIKELQTIFDSPDRYGKGLDWTGYTVHDAANVLRRYLNHLPEPIVPLDLYESFREPLYGKTYEAVGDSEAPQLFPTDFDEEQVIRTYQQLITELPPLNRQLLLYLLDLLAVFASKSDENRMGSQNLAAIFQPGMLSHPNHAMVPQEYQLNQCVVIFLIQNQDHFLIGMRGTAADEQTVQAVQKGGVSPANAPSAPIPKVKTSLARNSSNASAGADSIRKYGGIRRNVSTSSRHSRQSNGAPSPASPASITQQTSNGGVHRSNTVPSKRSPALPSGRRTKASASPTASPSASFFPTSPTTAPSPSPLTTSNRNVSPAPETASVAGGSERSQERLLPDSAEHKPEHRERNVSGLFSRATTTATEGEKKQPNKLRKRRIPESLNPSAQSSTHSLDGSSAAQSPSQPTYFSHEHPHLAIIPSANPLVTETHPTPPIIDNLDGTANARVADSKHSSEGTLKPRPSSGSVQSQTTSNDQSDINHTDTDDGTPSAEATEKRRRWRMSRRKESQGAHSVGSDPSSSKKNLGSNGGAELSSNSVSSCSQGKKGTAAEAGAEAASSLQAQQTSHEANLNNKEEKKGGPIDWFKMKMREDREKKREREAEKERTKSPLSEATKPEAIPKPLDLKGTDAQQGVDPQTS